MMWLLWKGLGASAFHLHLSNLAVICFRRTLEERPDDATALTYSAWLYSKRGELHESVKLYERLIRVAPDSVEGYVGAANGLQRLERHEAAIDYYREAIDRDPANSLSRYNLAISLFEVGRTQEAVGEYTRVVRANPTDAQAAGNLSAALGALKQWNDAAIWAERAMAAKPSATHAWNLGIALFELGRFPEAEMAFRRGLGFESSVPMQVRLALAMAHQKNYLDSLQNLREITRRNTGSIEAMAALVAVLTMKGDFDEAVQVAEQFVARWPELPLAHETLGWAFLKQGDAKQALAAYDRALQHDPDTGESHAGRGAALSLANRHSEAIEAFNTALAKAPDCFSDQPEFAEAFRISRAAMSAGR
jgi:tetratricopeptide (TPR) repeat protein